MCKVNGTSIIERSVAWTCRQADGQAGRQAGSVHGLTITNAAMADVSAAEATWPPQSSGGTITPMTTAACGKSERWARYDCWGLNVVPAL